MELNILPVCSGLDLDAFVALPWSIYKNSPNWVPPIRSQERDLLCPRRHPFWDNAQRRLFLAKRGTRLVGRIAAIVDHTYIDYAQTPCGAFGFFECENDPEAAHALLSASATWLRAQGMQYMRGPVNPSTNYTCGMLVDGFAEAPSLMMPWNPPYYPCLLESWEAYKEQDLLAYRITREAGEATEAVRKSMVQQADLSGFTMRKAAKKTLKEDIRTMLSLYRSSWSKNWYFSPLTAQEERALIDELLPIVDTSFFVLFFHGNEAAAGMVALPDLTPLLRAINGSLGITTPWHYWKTRHLFASSYRIMLFGILEKYRLFGLPALLFNYMLAQAQKNPSLRFVEGSWLLEENTAICDLLEDFSGTIAMRYRIYRKELDS